MQETKEFTIKSKNSPTSWKFVVKKEFLDICPNPEDYDRFELFEKFQLHHHLYNESGPTIIKYNNDVVVTKTYYMNGILTKEESN